VKVCLWSSKGGAGKTPVSYYLAKEHGYKIATNDYGVYDMCLKPDEFYYSPWESPFPEYPEDDIVFDLGGMLAKGGQSIVDAVKKSDLIIVPIFYEPTSVRKGVLSIREVLQFNKNIAVIATRLKSHSKDRGSLRNGYEHSFRYLSIKSTIDSLCKRIGIEIPVFPTANTTMYENMMIKRMSVSEMIKEDPLCAHSYKNPIRQIERVVDYIDSMRGGKK
jgi:hypothetical protein